MPLCFIYNSEFSAGKGPTILSSFPWYFCLWYIKQNLPSYLLKKSPIARFPFSSDKLIVRPNH